MPFILPVALSEDRKRRSSMINCEEGRRRGCGELVSHRLGWVLAGTAAEAIREARELDAADFADLCVDTDDYNVMQLARQIRERAGGLPRLTRCLE